MLPRPNNELQEMAVKMEPGSMLPWQGSENELQQPMVKVEPGAVPPLRRPPHLQLNFGMMNGSLDLSQVTSVEKMEPRSPVEDSPGASSTVMESQSTPGSALWSPDFVAYAYQMSARRATSLDSYIRDQPARRLLPRTLSDDKMDNASVSSDLRKMTLGSVADTAAGTPPCSTGRRTPTSGKARSSAAERRASRTRRTTAAASSPKTSSHLESIEQQRKRRAHLRSLTDMLHSTIVNSPIGSQSSGMTNTTDNTLRMGVRHLQKCKALLETLEDEYKKAAVRGMPSKQQASSSSPVHLGSDSNAIPPSPALQRLGVGRYREIFDNLSMPWFVMLPNGRMPEFSPLLPHLLGTTATELTEKSSKVTTFEIMPFVMQHMVKFLDESPSSGRQSITTALNTSLDITSHWTLKDKSASELVVFSAFHLRPT